MLARMVSFSASLAIVCLIASQTLSDESLTQQPTSAPATPQTAGDLQPLVDANETAPNLPTAAHPPRFFAQASRVPSRSVLRTNEATRDERPQDSNAPQPAADSEDLHLPVPAPPRIHSTSPAPLNVDVSSDSPPNRPVVRTHERRPPTPTRTPSDVNLTTAVPIIAIETVSPAAVNVGRTVKYVIAVRNRGDVAAENLKVVATLPEHVELLEAAPQPSDNADGELHFDVGRLGAGESKSIQLQLVPRKTGAIDLATRASFSVSTRTAMHVGRSQLTLTCEAPEEASYGDTVTFTLVVTNVGDGVAEGVVITPKLPSHAEADSRAQRPVSVGWLHPGDARRVPVTASAIGPGVIEARFTATDANGSKVDTKAKVRVRRAVVEVDTDGPQMHFLGREAVYEIHVANPGDTTAENVKVVASLPSGMRLTVLGRPVDFDRHRNTMTWYVRHLAAGGTERLAFKLKAVAEGEQVQEITVNAARGLHADARHLTQVTSRPKINVAISSSDGPLAVGNAAEFQVVVQNVGTKSAEGIHVKIIMPDALQPVVSDGYAIEDNQLTFSPMNLAAGQTEKLEFRAVGSEVGDHVVRVIMESQSPSYSLSAETSAFFYSSQETPRVTSLK